MKVKSLKDLKSELMNRRQYHHDQLAFYRRKVADGREDCKSLMDYELGLWSATDYALSLIS